MRSKTIMVWIVCLILIAGCLSACSLFDRNNKKEMAVPSQTVGPVSDVPESPVPSAAETEDQEPTPEAKQQTSVPTTEHTNETESDVAVEPSAVTELPEIEIPVAPAAPERADEPHETQSESDVTEPSMPSVSPAAPPNIVSQPETTPEPQQDDDDIIITGNGDILLPEAP